MPRPPNGDDVAFVNASLKRGFPPDEIAVQLKLRGLDGETARGLVARLSSGAAPAAGSVSAAPGMPADKAAQLRMGLISIAIGVAITGGTYLFAASHGGGMYILSIGPMMFGAIRVIKALS